MDAPIRLRWRGGFIVLAEVVFWDPHLSERWPETAVRELLELPASRFLTQLELVIDDYDHSSLGEAFGTEDLPLRSLWIGNSESSDIALGNLGSAWPSLPQLRALTIEGCPSSLGTLDLPNLKSAVFRLGVAASSVVYQIARANWPLLEALTIQHDGALPAIQELLTRDDLPLLGELRFPRCRYTYETIAALVRSPLAPQIFRLSLAHSTLTDDAVSYLVAHRARMPNLAMIDVAGTKITSSSVEALRTLAREVVT